MLNLLVISSLDFIFGVLSLLLLADGEFVIVDGVSAEGRTEVVVHALLELITMVVSG